MRNTINPNDNMNGPNLSIVEHLPELEDSSSGCQTFSNSEAKHFRAVLWDVQPLDVIQLACIRHARTSLFFLTEAAEAGTIFIDQGRIVHAECGSQQGMAALATIVSWQTGEIQEFTEWLAAVPKTIGMDWQIALMEASHMHDEAQQAAV